jgi:hypothetical protein
MVRIKTPRYGRTIDKTCRKSEKLNFEDPGFDKTSFFNFETEESASMFAKVQKTSWMKGPNDL